MHNIVGRIAFIGAGKMATAIAGGLVKGGIATEKIVAYDIFPEALEAFATKTGVQNKADSVQKVLEGSEIVILAVKPQNISDAMSAAAGSISGKLLISIAAGIRIEQLLELSGCERIIRVMPNTPALIGEGISAYAVSANVSGRDIAMAEKVLSAVGEFCRVKEDLMDAVTGLSGSGPAYVFEFIQSLADGGVNAGLPRDTALRLAVKTVYGAAKMLLETGEHPAVLKEQVTSPGGTTARGLGVMSRNAFNGIIIDAVAAAAERSAELGKK
jgi:pyrroline-5-carboxylate reductase